MMSETVENLNLVMANTAPALESIGEIVTFVLLVGYLLLTHRENNRPMIKRAMAKTMQSVKVNLGMLLFNSVLLWFCSVSTLYWLADQFSGYGILSFVDNLATKVALSVLAYDLLLYGWHRMCHQVDAFWLFHRVHHNDPYLNVSTAFRLHFVEVFLTSALKAVLIVALGIDKAMVLAIEAITTFCIMFHHANIRFEHEDSLGRILVVPKLHRVHHSTERSEHDNNYGAVFSLWDRMFGTLVECEPKKIGIKGNSPLDLFGLVKFGLGLDFPMPKPAYDLDSMIAEAAYYKAEKRNFRPGNEWRDWYEAKAEILGQIYGNKNRQRKPAAMVE